MATPSGARNAAAVRNCWRASSTPRNAVACTTAVLSNDAGVHRVRDRIGAEIHKRIKSALGPDADPQIVSALEMTYYGALVHAGSGTLTYHQVADRMAYVVGLILRDEN